MSLLMVFLIGVTAWVVWTGMKKREQVKSGVVPQKATPAEPDVPEWDGSLESQLPNKIERKVRDLKKMYEGPDGDGQFRGVNVNDIEG